MTPSSEPAAGHGIEGTAVGKGTDLADIAARSIEIMATGSLPDFEAVVHPDAVNREGEAEPAAARGSGPAAYFATAQWLRSAFADLHHEIHECVAAGDLVVLHTTMSGRQVGTFVVYDENAAVRTGVPADRPQFRHYADALAPDPGRESDRTWPTATISRCPNSWVGFRRVRLPIRMAFRSAGGQDSSR